MLMSCSIPSGVFPLNLSALLCENVNDFAFLNRSSSTNLYT